MGRRSINTTKSGKYMNPTDQARKEARKKELKKNKRQRQMVRAAVLKNKDPSQILEEMEKIDEMEYNVLQPSPLNEKVLRDKRKKLKETFDRVMRLYHTEEPEHWAELKRKEVEYEKKRLKKQQYYESVKHAQSVQIDEIPLPSATPSATTPATTTGLRLPPPPSALSLPPFAPGAPPSALKKPTDILGGKLPETSEAALARDKSGVPVGPPPDLNDMRELDSDAEDDEVILKKYVPKSVKAAAAKAKALAKPNSLQQRMLALSGQNIDEFMREMENVHKKKERERQAARGSSQKSRSDQDDDDDDKSQKSSDNEDDRHSRGVHSSDSEEDGDSAADSDVSQDTKRARRESKAAAAAAAAASAKPAPAVTAALPMPMPLPPSGLPPHVSVPGPPMPPVAGMPQAMLFRPPPLRPHGGMPAFGIRMPPGPPPGPRPRAPSMGGMPPRMGIRMPPGPPPGMPPRMAQHHKNMQQQQQQQQQQLQQQQKDSSKGVTTITAKPQIRNLSADVTRFVPSALRVKREETRKPNRTRPYAQEHTSQTAEGSKAATKDDAYLQFMNEMQGLL